MTATARDWSLHSGERQVTPAFAEASASHRHRYAWAADRLRSRPVRFGADVFCATGYGTAHLAAAVGGVWTGWDASAEAVALAHAAHPHLTFHAAEWPCPLPAGTMDAVVSLESLEHVEDDAGFLAALSAMLTPGGDLLLSVPNEARMPAAMFGNRFHVRHYTRDTLLTLAEAAGLVAVAEYGQRLWIPKGGNRFSRVADAETVVRPAAEFRRDLPCALLMHFTRAA